MRFMIIICKKCKNQFECSAADSSKKCWCFDKPNVISLKNEDAEESCLCPNCLDKKIEVYKFSKF